MKVGDRVKIRKVRGISTIAEVLPDVHGGVRLDKPLGGFRYWNISDLVRVPTRRAKAMRPNCVAPPRLPF